MQEGQWKTHGATMKQRHHTRAKIQLVEASNWESEYEYEYEGK